MKTIIFLLSLFWGQTLIAQQIARTQLLPHLKNSRQLDRHNLRQNLRQNPNVIKQSLDSIIYQDWYDTSNLWQNSRKTLFEYDNFGRITTITEFIWDDNNQVFKNFDKMNYQYNTDGDMIQFIEQEWSQTHQDWINDQKVDYQYNNHFLVEKNFSQWDDNSSTWELSFKYEYTYDNNGNLVSRIMYGNTVHRPRVRNMNSLQPQHKTTYTYDNLQNLIEKTNYNWDINSQDWQLESKNIYNYTNNLLSEAIYYVWNDINQSWANQIKRLYSYNTNNLLTELIIKEWDENTSQWVNSEQWIYYFDSDDNLIQEIYKSWSNNTWINEDRYDYTYDNSYVYDDLILPKYYWDDNIEDYMQSVFTHKLINGIGWTWDTTTNSWKKDMKYDLYFNPRNISGINNNNLTNIKIYPNPVNNLLVLNFDKKINGRFELYNLTGQKLLSQPIQSAKQTINLQQTPSGIYLYRIKNNKGQLVGKLIKK